MLLHETPDYFIHCYKLGQLKTNTYLVIHRHSSNAFLVDPADDGDFLSQEIISHNVRLQQIILTHGHFDHVGGLLPLKLNFNPNIALHSADQSIYGNANDSAKYWGINHLDPTPPIDQELTNSQTISLPDDQLSWQIIATPGHTPGSVSIYQKENQLLFSGDTLFYQTIGRTDFSYASPERMKTSLKTLLKLPASTIIFPGHGRPTTIDLELPNLPTYLQQL